jgi:hypothetical protein
VQDHQPDHPVPKGLVNLIMIIHKSRAIWYWLIPSRSLLRRQVSRFVAEVKAERAATVDTADAAAQAKTAG